MTEQNWHRLVVTTVIGIIAGLVGSFATLVVQYNGRIGKLEGQFDQIQRSLIRIEGWIPKIQDHFDQVIPNIKKGL